MQGEQDYRSAYVWGSALCSAHTEGSEVQDENESGWRRLRVFRRSRSINRLSRANSARLCVQLTSRILDAARPGSAMLGHDTEVTRAREHRPLSRGSSDGPQPYQGRPSVGPVPPSRCGPAILQHRWMAEQPLTCPAVWTAS